MSPRSDLRVGQNEERTRTSKKPRKTKIGTWNVNTLLKCGKLENVKKEMRRIGIDILGLSEVRWPEEGDFWSDEFRVIHSGTAKERPGYGGVAIMLNKDFGRNVTGYVQYNERVMLVRVNTKPKNTVIIQVYAPTTSHEDEEVEEMYEGIEKLIESVRSDENLIIMGDFNAVVGEGKSDEATGSFGLGKRNERGETLTQFCIRSNLCIANTFFDHPLRRRYTWKMPGDINRYQIDYILVRKRFKNQVKDCHSYPGADVDSDHNLVLAKCCLKFKKLRRRIVQNWDVGKLKNEECKETYQKRLKEQGRAGNGNMSIEEEWEVLKNNILHSAKSAVGIREQENRKPWITEDLLNLMEERRKLKNSNKEEDRIQYKRLRNAINRGAKEEKEKYIAERCEEVEQCMKNQNMEQGYKLIKIFLGGKKGKGKGGVILDEEGTILLDRDLAAKRWKRYLEELYGNETNHERNVEDELVKDEDEGVQIMKEEFNQALEKLKNQKAPGNDNISAELIKATGEEEKERLYKLMCRIYEEGKIPEDFGKCIIIPIPKKSGANKCENYRTLSLVTHASKILTTVINKRIERVIDKVLSEDQFGFRKGRGTREAILSLRLIIEKRMVRNKDTYIAFVDLEKAFDSVKWEVMFEILKRIGIKYHDRRIIWELYKNEVGIIKGDSKEEIAKIKKGVRQGCSLSPYLFNVYIQDAIDKIREEKSRGISIQGHKIDMIRFADDIAVLGETEQELNETLQDMEKTMRLEYNLKINKGKTKVMRCSREMNQGIYISINGQRIEEVSAFTYLGSKMTNDGRCKKDIISRINQAKRAFNAKKSLLTSNGIDMKIRKRLVKGFIWSVALYACETWTIGTEERRKLESFEMWCYRRIMRIKWVDKVTNEEVLRRIGEGRELWKSIRKRRMELVGHILRHNSIVRTIMEGYVEGGRYRGRPRLEYMQQIKEDTGCHTYEEVKRKANERLTWRTAANQS